jgi:hypothetical protein
LSHRISHLLFDRWVVARIPHPPSPHTVMVILLFSSMASTFGLIAVAIASPQGPVCVASFEGLSKSPYRYPSLAHFFFLRRDDTQSSDFNAPSTVGVVATLLFAQVFVRATSMLKRNAGIQSTQDEATKQAKPPNSRQK